ncbi:unnamed protein product [Allacma fusca]|uniref:Major facilitator superfamily (MFS) profile domain-containing protein n=1 Tax=Allacma fusca TaxID=39272 RepID=A0A8J2KQR0_9HEXA|nr:unnamed protein product [Allacma fusca]
MEERKEVNLKQQTLHSFLVALSYVFLGSSEQMVILPSVWPYIQNLSGEPQTYWIGFTISAYSFAGILSGLFIGWLSEKFKFRTKAILIGCLFFKITGNFQYMLGMSVWNVACGRLLQGIGSGAGTALLAEFGRVTTSKERTTFLSIFNATFQIGMIFGPVIQIVVSYLNFEIFGITLNALNGPGLVWTILWSLLMLKALFFFSNLTKDFNEPRNSQSDISLKPMMAKFGGRNEQESSGSGDQKSSTRDDIFPNNSKQERDFPSKSHSTLLLMVFVAFFCQGALEVWVPF